LSCVFLLAAVTAAAAPGGKTSRPPSPRCEGRLTATLEAARVNDANLRDRVDCGAAGAAVLRAQILLDRANFSCGEIDAVYGANLRGAIAAFQKSWGLAPDGVVTDAVWDLLNRDRAQAIGTYTIVPEDIAGPFQKIPRDMMAKADLPSLGFQSAAEALAEKFHVSPALLARLNPGKTFDRASEILVPNVLTAPPGKAATIMVSESSHCVCAFDASRRMLSYYPATIGSEHDPLPIGEWKIEGVRFNPVFFYNPELFWDAAPNHSKTKIAPGPNNPVGVVWIDLSKPHYGIHGTPEPSTIGRRQSHGCIRLTNWDAAELAQMVSPGTPARLEP